MEILPRLINETQGRIRDFMSTDSVLKPILHKLFQSSITTSRATELYWNRILTPDDLAEYEKATKDLHTPFQVNQFMKEHLAYKSEIIDSWRIPPATFKLGYGDCDDYSALAFDVLRRRDYSVRMMAAFNYTGGHMVCTYQSPFRRGSYCHISNWGDYRVYKANHMELAETIYPDWVRAYVIDKRKEEPWRIIAQLDRNLLENQ